MTLAYADAPKTLGVTLDLAPAAKPHTIVLQPDESLNQTNSLEFQTALKNALEQVTEAVIVDLLWVGSTDADGIAALVAGMQRAATLGKFLSFQSINASVQLALEVAWAQQQEMRSGAWTHTFSSDLESFLDGFMPGEAMRSSPVSYSNSQSNTAPTVNCKPTAKSGTGKASSGSSKSAT